MGGHIRLSRDITDWGWYKDSCTFRVFFHLLMKANWKNGEYMGHKIERGSLVTGRKQLALELGLSERNIRTAIDHLKSTNELTIKTTNKFSIITLCKYERWVGEEIETDQQNDQQCDQQPTNNRPTTDQQPTTIEENNKEINKENKEYNNNSPAEQEFRQVEENLRNEIAELKKQLEEAKKEKPQRAKPVQKTLVSKAQAIFMEHYKALGLSDTDYYWGAKDGQNMKLLLNKIKYSRESRGKTTDDDSMINALNSFLMCIKDKWILSHYEVSVINSKYNEIVASAKISTANEDDILKNAYKNIGLNKEAEIYGLDTYEFSMLTDQQREVWRKKNKTRLLEYLRNHEQ